MNPYTFNTKYIKQKLECYFERKERETICNIVQDECKILVKLSKKEKLSVVSSARVIGKL